MEIFGSFGCVGAAVPAAPAWAPVADSYKDKRVKIIVGGPPGGGVGRYGRVTARRIFHHLPLRPPFPRSDASPG